MRVQEKTARDIEVSSGGRLRVDDEPIVSGRVFGAFDRLQGFRVIVKVSEDPEETRAELFTLRLLAHPGIVPALDSGRWRAAPAGAEGADEEAEATGFTYLTEPHIEGQDLGQRAGQLDVSELRGLMIFLLSMVDWLHRQGRVALDLKPAHLIHAEGLGWRLIDLEQSRPDDAFVRDRLEGTVPFLAPEVLMGEGAGVASDLYTVGLLLRFGAGAPPPLGDGATLAALGAQRAREGIPPGPAALRGDPRLLTLHDALLDPSPARRPRSAAHALEILGAAGVSRGPLGQGPFIGEAERLEALDAHLAAAPRGGALRCVSPPGGGLTRTLRRWVDVLQLRGRPALFLGARPDPIGGLLSLAGVKADGEDDVAQARALLGGLGDHACPRVIVIDDADALDPPGRRLLSRLAYYAEGEGIFVVIGTHGGGWEGLPTWRVPGLDAEGSRRLAEALVGADALRSEGELQMLLTLTEGRPAQIRAFLEEVEGGGRPDLNTWHPPGAEARVAGALEGLSEGALRCVLALSHVRAPFSRPLAEAVLARAGEARLAPILAAGLLRGEPAGLAWEDEGLRRSLAARAQGWDLLAAALVERCLFGEALPPALVAEACLLGGQVQQGIPWAMNALMQPLPTMTAIRLREILLPQLPGGSPGALQNLTALGALYLKANAPDRLIASLSPHLTGAPREDAPLKGLLCLARVKVGDLDGALEDATLAHPHLAEELAAEVGLTLAWLHLQRGELEDAHRVLEGLEGSPWHRGEVLRARVSYLRVLLAQRGGGEPAELIPTARRLLTSRAVKGDAGLSMKLHNLLANLYRTSGDGEGAATQMTLAVASARSVYDLPAEATATFNWANALREIGQAQEAANAYLRAAQLFCALGDRRDSFRARLWALDLLSEVGSLSRVEGELEATQAALESQGEERPSDGEHLALIRLRLQIRQGKGGPEVQEALEALVGRMDPDGEDEAALGAVGDLAELALGSGQASMALEILSPWLARCQGGSRFQRRLHALAARAHRALSREEAPGEEEARRGEEARLGSVSGRLLTQVGALLDAVDDPAREAALLARFAGESVGGRGLIRLNLPDGDRTLSAHGMSPGEVGELNERVVSRVLASGEPLIAPDVCADPQLMRIRSLRVGSGRSMVCLPILDRGEILGVLYVDHLKPGEAWSQEMYETLKRYAAMASRFLKVVIARGRLRRASSGSDALIGESEAMQSLRREIERYGRSTEANLRLYIEGPTGVGKSLVGRLIHQARPKSAGHFFQVTCGSFKKELMGSELFGHVKGAFTGADADKVGLLEAIKGGTLLLDEVDMLPMEGQASLLPAIESAVFTRLGRPEEERAVEGWIICASNRDLHTQVMAGAFRSDLMRRLTKSGALKIPSLRERGEGDILLLAEHALSGALQEVGRDPQQEDLYTCLSADAIAALIEHPWPWNVAEICNLFQRVTIKELLSRGLRVDHGTVQDILNVSLSEGVKTPDWATLDHIRPGSLSYKDFQEELRPFVGHYFLRTLRDNGSNIAKTARALEVSRDTLYAYLKQVGWERR